jgi:transcriptional regulator with XRE-family HTH domain
MPNSLANQPRATATDYAQLAAELMRHLRGPKRSRPGFSRFLGYRSNIAQRWETGLCAPTSTRFFAICTRLGVDVRGCVANFLRREPAWLASATFDAASGVAALLAELRGRTLLCDIADRSASNRYTVSRWLKGTATPKLPELLRLIDACNGRALDFVATLADPAALPSAAARWRELSLSRELAYTHPLAHAVLRGLELHTCRQRKVNPEVYLARKLGMSKDDVRESLELLAASGQVRKTRQGWALRARTVVDTGGDSSRARGLKLEWTRVALRRLEAGAPGHCGYSVFAIAREDLRRLRDVQLAYVREMQSIIAASTKSDCVGLYCAQLLDLATPEANAFRSLSG